jgi:hypothetical protein
MSLPPSRAGSEAADDILAPDEIINPLGAMSNMAGLVEAAVERAKEEQAKTTTSTNAPGKRPAGEVDGNQIGGSAKRVRIGTGTTISETQPGVGPTGAKGKAKMRRTHVHAFPDAVSEGYVSEEEGKEMLDM